MIVGLKHVLATLATGSHRTSSRRNLPFAGELEKSTNPAQIRLRAYLDGLICQLLPLPDDDAPLFLHLDVDVREPQRLLRHYDLENYLTPLFGLRYLPASRFNLVTARKYVGGGSRIAWGRAAPALPATGEWASFTISAGRGATLKAWKERIRSALAATAPAIIPPGPARVRLAWRCGAHRNWSTLWKPTGDAMGPVLGAANPQRPYHLDDDRIVDLELHRIVDQAVGHDVEVGMWWQASISNLSDQ